MNVPLVLPYADGTLEKRVLCSPRSWSPPSAPFTSRVAYAAAHVVADPLGGNVPGAPAALDWDATLAFRHHLWSYGFGVAEAMDTAQRGMGLDWSATRELIQRSAAEARSVGGRIAAGAGTDHHGPLATVDDVVDAYREQLEVVDTAGARPILMASRQLAAIARGPDDYLEVYGRLLAEIDGPVLLHWLGPMFDPALEGYWGHTDLDRATETFLGLVREHAAKVEGVKVSLLDLDHEVGLRRALPDGVRLYTGDDFNYLELIRGDEVGASDALLGILAAIAPAASVALQALDRDDDDGYEQALAPTVPLSRHIFSTPTYHYKVGIAFLAWLNGHQPGFTMVGGLQSGRDVMHLADIVRLADDAQLLVDPELAALRMSELLSVAGVRP